jgi:hypothetical protein
MTKNCIRETIFVNEVAFSVEKAQQNAGRKSDAQTGY